MTQGKLSALGTMYAVAKNAEFGTANDKVVELPGKRPLCRVEVAVSSNTAPTDMESVFMYWWSMCGILRTHICFCVYTLYTTFWDSFIVVLSCNRTQCGGLGTYSCLYILSL